MEQQKDEIDPLDPSGRGIHSLPILGDDGAFSAFRGKPFSASTAYRSERGFPDPDRSELYFLAGRCRVAGVASPAVSGELEGAITLIAKEHPGLATPVATDHVRVPERRVGAENGRGDRFLVANQIITAQHLSRSHSYNLSVQVCSYGEQHGRRRHRGL